MDLRERLDNDMKIAMKNKEKTKLSVIRMVRASIKKLEIDKKSLLNDEEVMAVVVKEIKQRRDSVAEFQKADRDDLVQKEKAELEILQSYLPEQLSEEALRALIQQEIQNIGATSKADMGKVMGAVVPKIRGKADGKLAQLIVQEYLK